MINVTKSFLPPLGEFTANLKEVWENGILTNRGPLVQRLEDQLVERFQCGNLLYVTNGTIALQLAFKALDLKGEVITTPFSFVATTTALLWENLKPVFVDIHPESLCIDPSLIESAITPKTSGILATHVFGNPCDVLAIEQVAKKHNLKVIYDAAHAFDVSFKGKSILQYGDASTLSFHATKVFNTGEGGGVVIRNNEQFEKLKLLHSFGHIRDDHYLAGINGKNSEIHAALGLTNLPYIKSLISQRQAVFGFYEKNLPSHGFRRPSFGKDVEQNFSYYPVIFESEEVLTKVMAELANNQIYSRRYFYPSLNLLPYVAGNSCPVSEQVSNTILCLPLYPDLSEDDVKKICVLIKKVL